MNATLIFPNQLFLHHPHLKDWPVYLVEDDTYFTRYRFHKQKLVLHRASMKYYMGLLNGDVHYIENEAGKTIEILFEQLKSRNVEKLLMTEVLDHKLEDQLSRMSKKYKIELYNKENPGFINDQNQIIAIFKSGYFNMTSFYISQRKKLNILQEMGKPVGGKWSFDPANRKKLPKNIEVPEPRLSHINEYIEGARRYVDEKFKSNPGCIEGYTYPVTHDEAKQVLDDFIENRLRFFGDYQDAITNRSHAVFHSLLSSSLNTGLITPQTVIDSVLEANNRGDVSLNNVEGFIRQIIGWREYMRAVYLIKGRQMINSNILLHNRNLPISFYDASTGIIPLDDVLDKVNRTAYAHHIERLMIIGNFLLLSMIEPGQVFRWFMEMFIDSYEWVMVPNVMAMSQYADNSITTKPYVSSSAYIRLMSDYSKGDWADIWDSLFWNFIIHHREILEKIPRMNVMIYNLDKMTDEKKKSHMKRANEFLLKIEDRKE